ncbi:MAG TPA: BTAD domain-containing putative transcriptional regulator [Reyranella sp.]|nr:BTAD domain-containing putative transcriptional regulator [Reyranella sp.]
MSLARLDRDRPAAEAVLRLTTLGRFDLAGPAGSIKLGSKKLCALLAYLACTAPAPQSREKLMTLLWGSHFEAQARQNLRQSLSRLRRAVGPDVLEGNDEQVALRPGAVVCDAVELAGTGDLARAADLYRGPFLADVTVEEPEWTEWQRERRTRLEAQALAAHLKLARKALDAERPDEALARAEAASRIDELSEEACRLAMRALAAGGRRAEALRRYNRFAETLKKELGVGTDAATSALAAELRTAEAGLRPLPRPELPARPSIAVLPFANLSGDAAEDYFVDGVVEDLIVALSRLRWLFVIARNSSFTYKNRTVDIREVGRELGVRYILQGSIRVSGTRVRIAAQLVEAESGANVWVDSFDRELGDIFALQDAITTHIVVALEPNLRSAEIARVRGKPTQSLDAYDLYLQALSELYTVTEQGYARAEARLRRSIALDPNYVDALVALGECRIRLWLIGAIPLDEIPAVKTEIYALARRAVVADPESGIANAAEAYALVYTSERFDEAMEAAGRALAAHPNSVRVCFLASAAYTHSGEDAKALPWLEHCLRLDPRDPRRFFTFNGLAMNHFFARRFEEAERWSLRALSEMPTFTFARRLHAASLAHLGRLEEARADVRALLEVQPNSTLTRSRTSNFRWPYMYDLYIGGLQLAGLPEK